MMKAKQIISSIAAIAAASTMLALAGPVANAAEGTDTAVASARSFPKVTSVKKNLLAEATSTSADADADWGGIESLDVPQTQSQAEKDAAKAAEQAEAANQAASRSEQRQDLGAAASTQSSAPAAAIPTPPASANGSAIAAYATQFVGYPYAYGGNTPSGWDCSGFVQWVFAQQGISLPRTSGAQATVGVAVPSLAEAQPGDILADGIHAAIYIGGGMVVNAMTPALGTGISSTAVFMGRPFAIRRVL